MTGESALSIFPGGNNSADLVFNTIIVFSTSTFFKSPRGRFKLFSTFNTDNMYIFTYVNLAVCGMSVRFRPIP